MAAQPAMVAIMASIQRATIHDVIVADHRAQTN